ncbi:MAG: type II toxin-antitoxin system HicA family toxin [Thermodesulfobacteriota bacterium]
MRSISGKELCRHLERQGWVLNRSKGSHFMYEKEGFPLLVVPVHGSKPLRIGTLKGLLRDAGLTEADLDAA